MDFSNSAIRKANYDKVIPFKEKEKALVEERIDLTEIYGNTCRYSIKVRKRVNEYGYTRALIKIKDTITGRIVYNGNHPAKYKEDRLRQIVRQYHKKYSVIEVDEFKDEKN